MIRAEVVFLNPKTGTKFTGRAVKHYNRDLLHEYIDSMAKQGYIMDEVHIINKDNEQE
jgi:hypothetical protein